MAQSQTASHSTATLVLTALLAAAGGFGAGYWVGRADQTDAGEIPCPPCKFYKDQVTSECRLVGRIDPDWGGGPVFLSGPMESPRRGGDRVSYARGQCFELVVDCAHEGSSLRFEDPSRRTYENPWCTGAGCAEVGACE